MLFMNRKKTNKEKTNFNRIVFVDTAVGTYNNRHPHPQPRKQ
jgi:hypothetical protein